MTTNATPVPDVTTEKGQSCSPHSRHSSQDSSSDMRSPRLGSDAPPARMGTHWETCGIDGGLWHWDCAQALIADLTRERDEAQADFTRATELLDVARSNNQHNAERFVRKRIEWREQMSRAERAEAERDTLAAIVRAADAMRTVYATDGCECSNCAKAREYDRARAKWEGKP